MWDYSSLGLKIRLTSIRKLVSILKTLMDLGFLGVGLVGIR
jgi:hypothetical protein